MHTQTPLETLSIRMKQTPFAVLVLVFGGIALGFALLLTAVVPRSVAMTYTKETCVQELTLAPTLMTQHAYAGYSIVYKDAIALFGTPIASLRTCFTPQLQPREGTTTLHVVYKGLGASVATYELQVPALPVASAEAITNGETVGTAAPVTFSLSAPDELHQYSLYLGEARSRCETEQRAIRCDVADLDLTQGETYDARLERQFGTDVPEVLVEGELATIEPVRITDVSIDANEVLYTKPQFVEVTFDKPITSVEASLKAKDGDSIAVEAAIEGTGATITWEAELPRQTTFELLLDSVIAEDGSGLLEPFTRTFKTSGGPSVTGVSVGPRTAPVAGTVTVTLDQPVASVQAALQKIRVSGVNATIGLNNRTISIQYSTGLCQPFTITVDAGLESRYGIVNNESWSYSSRTQCYSTTVIGTSEQGRAIVAYRFGSGSNTILYTGALHGNEQNTKLLMDAWIAELEANPGSIKKGTQLIIIPVLNPDGLALNTRANARNVDLNRNFDTSDWKEDIQNIYGNPYPGGGGSSPLSERESKAIATYTQQLAPRLTLSFHSVAGYVIANTCGDSRMIASEYASRTGYANKTGVSGAFSYEITGTYDDWICERLGRASILIELATTWSAEFERNRSALWYTAGL